MTWPLVTGLTRLGRTTADGPYSIWNVAWGRDREEEIRLRLRPFAPHLRRIASDDTTTLYEVVSFP